MTNKIKKTLLFFILISLVFTCKKANKLPDSLEAGWKEKSVCKVIEETDKLRVLKCTFKPGVGHEKHYHKPHIGYTLKGSKFQITNKNGIREVNVFTESTFSNNKISEHKVLNIGDSTAVFLIIESK